jgi:hypothetical protein
MPCERQDYVVAPDFMVIRPDMSHEHGGAVAAQSRNANKFKHFVADRPVRIFFFV